MLENIKITPLIDSIQLLNISDEEYFSAKYKDYISNSSMALINPTQMGSPEKYAAGMKNEYKDFFDVGSAIHQIVLQPQYYYLVETIFKPSGKLGPMIDRFKFHRNKRNDFEESIYKASQDVDYYKNKLTGHTKNKAIEKCYDFWRHSHKHIDKTTDKEPIFLNEANYKQAKPCIESLLANKEICELLNPTVDSVFSDVISKNEYVILIDMKFNVDGKEIILKFKSKLDNYTIDVEGGIVTLNDLKSTFKKQEDFKYSFDSFHYARQMAFYGFLLRLYVQKEYQIEKPTYRHNMLVVSTSTQESFVYGVLNKDINAGKDEFVEIMRRIAWHTVYGFDKLIEEPEKIDDEYDFL